MARLRQKRRGGKWFLDYRDIDGTRYRIDTGTHDKKVAELWFTKVEELMAKARLGIIEKVGRVDADVIAGRQKKEKPSLTIEAFKATYEDRCRHDLELAEGTITLNNFCFASFTGAIGNKPLDELTDDDVRTWKRHMDATGRSKTTLSMYHRQLRAAFNRAVKWGMTKVNPFNLVEISKGRQVAPGEKDMSYEEVRKLLKTIDEDGNRQFATFVRFVLYTGCRRNEILFLHWEDIDLNNLSLKVRAQKTGRHLVLPINKALKRVLDGMVQQEIGYVFQAQPKSRRTGEPGQPWHEDSASHWFKHYVCKAGLSSHYSLHSLRHTYATYLRQQGVPVDIVQKLLGHTSSRTTSENYDHTIALHFRAQADMVDFERE